MAIVSNQNGRLILWVDPQIFWPFKVFQIYILLFPQVLYGILKIEGYNLT